MLNQVSDFSKTDNVRTPKLLQISRERKAARDSDKTRKN